METYHSKIRVYTNGLVQKGVGAYCYIVVESTGPGTPSILRAKFAQSGETTDVMRMRMRAIYEGVRHCPDHSCIEICTEDTLVSGALSDMRGFVPNADIAERYRRYIQDRCIVPDIREVRAYTEDDFPCDDHTEWVWWARTLCEDAIKKHIKEQAK